MRTWTERRSEATFELLVLVLWADSTLSESVQTNSSFSKSGYRYRAFASLPKYRRKQLLPADAAPGSKMWGCSRRCVFLVCCFHVIWLTAEVHLWHFSLFLYKKVLWAPSRESGMLHGRDSLGPRPLVDYYFEVWCHKTKSKSCGRSGDVFNTQHPTQYSKSNDLEYNCLIVLICFSIHDLDSFCAPRPVHLAQVLPPPHAGSLPIILMNLVPDRVSHHSFVPCWHRTLWSGAGHLEESVHLCWITGWYQCHREQGVLTVKCVMANRSSLTVTSVTAAVMWCFHVCSLHREHSCAPWERPLARCQVRHMAHASQHVNLHVV